MFFERTEKCNGCALSFRSGLTCSSLLTMPDLLVTRCLPRNERGEGYRTCSSPAASTNIVDARGPSSRQTRTRKQKEPEQSAWTEACYAFSKTHFRSRVAISQRTFPATRRLALLLPAKWLLRSRRNLSARVQNVLLTPCLQFHFELSCIQLSI